MALRGRRPMQQSLRQGAGKVAVPTMRLTWEPRHTGDTEYGLIFGAIAGMLLVAATVLPLSEYVPACTFRSFTGFPCPACGSTRALAGLAQGKVLASAAFNPLCVAVVAAALLAFLLNGIMLLFRLPRPSLHLTTCESSCVRTLAAMLLLVNWAFLIVHL